MSQNVMVHSGGGPYSPLIMTISIPNTTHKANAMCLLDAVVNSLLCPPTPTKYNVNHKFIIANYAGGQITP